MSFFFAAGALCPHSHYTYGIGSNQLNALREAFERMADVDTAAAALSEAQSYRLKSHSFTNPLAQKMACDGTTSPGSYIFARKSIRFAAWWQIFGYSTPSLQWQHECHR